MRFKPSACPEFSKPPINEIVIGVSFQRPTSFTVAHLGLFWAKLRDQFPKTEDHSPIGDLATVPMANGLPLPRIWLVEENDNKLVQLQLDRTYLNWRRRRPGDQYPRFSALSESFQSYWSKFCEFVRDVSGEPLVLSGAELSKINHFPQGDGWNDISEVGSILEPVSSLKVQGLTHSTYVGYKSVSKFDDSNVTVELKTGKKLADGIEQSLFVLETKAQPDVRGLPADEAELFDKFIRANDVTNLIFTSITTLRAQTELWGRTS